jgi:drug/metabolite transporter (DMT)-like permease
MLKARKTLVVGSIAICTSATMWGLDGIVLTPQLYNLDITFVVFILHAVPFLLMNILFFKKYRYLRTFKGKDLLTLFLVALTGGALGTMAIVKALFLVEFRELSVVVLLQKLQPVFAIILAAIILREKVNKNFAFWAIIAIIAGYFLTFGFDYPRFNTGEKTGLAAAFSLLAAFCFGSATVLGKSLLNNLSFSTATFYRYGFTSLIMLLFVVAGNKLFEFQNVTPQNWKIIIIISLTVGSGAIYLYYFGLNKVPAMLASIFELCFPLSAILFDYAFHGKTLSLVQWISVAIMLTAIIRINISGQRIRE